MFWLPYHCQKETYANVHKPGAISDIAQLCSIVSEPVTVLPFATASTAGSYTGVFTTVGVVSSSIFMPSVYSTSGTASTPSLNTATSITSVSRTSTAGQTSTILPTSATSQASSTTNSAASSLSATSSTTTTASTANSLGGHWKAATSFKYISAIIITAWALYL